MNVDSMFSYYALFKDFREEAAVVAVLNRLKHFYIGNFGLHNFHTIGRPRTPLRSLAYLHQESRKRNPRNAPTAASLRRRSARSPTPYRADRTCAVSGATGR